MGSLAGFSKTKPLVLLPLCQLELLAGVGGFPDAELVVRRSEWRKEPILSLGGWPHVSILHLPGPPVEDTPEAGAGGRCWARIHSSQAPRPQNAGCGARLSPAWG